MLRQLKKIAVVSALTLTSLTGLSAMGGNAYAAAQVPPPPVPSPICYGLMDTLGNGGKACVDSITRTAASGSQTGTYVQVDGHVDACYLFTCRRTNYSTLKNGAGVDDGQVVTYSTGSIAVPVPVSTCVKTTCTPTTVNMPTLQLNFLPPGGGPAVSFCVYSVCSSPLISIGAIEFDTGDVARSVSTS